MKRYEQILVCIDQPERVSAMSAFVRALARLASTRRIHVLHVSEEHSQVVADEAGQAPEALTLQSLEALAAEHFDKDGKGVCRCEVRSGAPLLEILRTAHDEDVDLIVIGRDYGPVATTRHEALLARRITRKATCSVLVLPEEYQVKADTILVPVRDSQCSANALDVACGIAVATEAVVVALNVFQVHAGYSRVGVTLEEHEALLEAAAHRECERLLKRVNNRGVEIRSKCAADLEDRPVPVIMRSIDTESADLVVIGARGRSGAAGVLLGNITEQLIRESPVPLLAVKEKGECVGLLRALLMVAGEG